MLDILQFTTRVKMKYVQISNSNISSGNKLLRKLLQDIDFSDVTLVTVDNQHIPAHRSVLSASSPFLRRILFESLQQSTFLYISIVESEIVQALVNFIYLGRCEIRQELLAQLNSFAIQMGVGSLQIAIESSETSQLKIEAEKTGEKLSTVNLINNTVDEAKRKAGGDGAVKENVETAEEDNRTTEEEMVAVMRDREEEPMAGDDVTEMVIVMKVEEAGVKEMGDITVGGYAKTIHKQTDAVVEEPEVNVHQERATFFCTEPLPNGQPCHTKIIHANYKRHLTTHQEKRFKCDKCGQCFARMDNLVKHNRESCKSDPQLYPFNCLACGRKYKTENKEKAHRRQGNCVKTMVVVIDGLLVEQEQGDQ